MAEARKSYMTKEQLEQYLADLRNNRPQRPNGSRALTNSVKSRWSILRSTTVPPPDDPPSLDPNAPPTLYSATPPPALTRRESKLLRKHSSPSHKRSSTTSSILSFAKSPPRSTAAISEPKGWNNVDRPDEHTGDTDASSSQSSESSKKKKNRGSAPPGSLRGFSYAAGLNEVTNGSDRRQSISSGCSSSSGNSDRKKRVSWKLPTTTISPSRDSHSVIMPPCYPPKPSDAPKIEKELTRHFDNLSTQGALPTVAPLRINKTVVSSTPSTSGSPRDQNEPLTIVPERAPIKLGSGAVPKGRREYGAPYPRRPEYVEPWKQEPTQHNHPKYMTNTDPLHSPPNSGSEEEDNEAEILKELGRRPLPKNGDASTDTADHPIPVRKNTARYGAQIQPPPPPVIAIVTPSSTITATKPRNANSAPVVVPTINLPQEHDNPRTTNSSPAVPFIDVSDQDNSKVPYSSANVKQDFPQSSSRPLPQPRARPSSVYSSASTAGRSRGPTATCNLCRVPIEGRIVAAGSLRFHSECFRCDHCQTPLEHVGFYPEPPEHRRKRLERSGIEDDHSNGTGVRFYCHLDFHELFSPRCKSCKTPIEGEVVVACGNTWHQGHFFCAECGDPFEAKSKFVEKDGYAWCVGCYTNRYSGRCKKCKRPVTDTVVKALGGEWHEECFVCMECGSGFDDGRFFVRGNDGRETPVCVKCEERRLKA